MEVAWVESVFANVDIAVSTVPSRAAQTTAAQMVTATRGHAFVNLVSLGKTAVSSHAVLPNAMGMESAVVEYASAKRHGVDTTALTVAAHT